MSVRDEVLKTLEENKGDSLSGEALATALGVSRAAVWKAIRSLKSEGYRIDAVQNKGYTLAQENDLLSEQAIALHLSDKNRHLPIHVYKIVDSTNAEAKRLALTGVPHGTVVIAEEQTSGRGRLGRDFFSPANSGIYLSIIIKPDFDISKSVLITTAAAVAVYRALKEVCGIESDIKWVNDVYIGGKKICGILTEAVTDFETGTIEYIVLGIGINCRIPAGGYPRELQEKVGTVNPDCHRNHLAGEVINQVTAILDNLDSREFLGDYKRRCFILGKEIELVKHYSNREISENPEALRALALDIDADGGLVVEFPDGCREILNTGEISVRL